jgi:acyl carrier protein
MISRECNVIYNNKTYGYKDIILYVNAIYDIIEKLPKKTMRIGIVLDRNIWLIGSILGSIYSGCTYVPISKSLPETRIKVILDDANCDLLIIDTQNEHLCKPYNCLNVDKVIINNDEIIREYKFNKIINIIYTSGTTGKPKGVKVTREGMLNLIESLSEIIDFSTKKKIACLASISFDIFFVESIMSLIKGLTVVLMSENQKYNPKYFMEFIEKNNIDILQMTPSMLQFLVNYDENLISLKNVKEILIGGEQFPLNLLKILQKNTIAKIYNLYGPTETTIWATVSDLTKKCEIDIGKPLKNIFITIANENCEEIPVGEIGEICISGVALAEGYLGADKLTNEKFLTKKNKNIYFYRTGDLGRYNKDGYLEYLGRIDNQIKIRGYRIEPEEIEANINKFDDIFQSIVIARTINGNDKIIEAYYVSNKEIDNNMLAEYLKKNIPEYMIPNKYIRVESFSYTQNGKIDRKYLYDRKYNVIGELSIHSGLDEIQKRIYDIIRNILSEQSFNDVNLETKFTEIGLDSITYVKLIIALEQEFQVEFSDEILLLSGFSTVKSLIEYLIKNNELM